MNNYIASRFICYAIHDCQRLLQGAEMPSYSACKKPLNSITARSNRISANKSSYEAADTLA